MDVYIIPILHSFKVWTGFFNHRSSAVVEHVVKDHVITILVLRGAGHELCPVLSHRLHGLEDIDFLSVIGLLNARRGDAIDAASGVAVVRHHDNLILGNVLCVVAAPLLHRVDQAHQGKRRIWHHLGRRPALDLEQAEVSRRLRFHHLNKRADILELRAPSTHPRS